MSSSSSAAIETDERVLVIERVFDAPRELVFKAWTEPDRLTQWMGPRGFTITLCQLDLRPGGAYRFHMRSPEGTEHRVHGVLREVVPPEQFAYTWAWVDAQGESGPETLLTLTFGELGGKTKLTLHQAIFESVTARDQHRGGWNSALDCLAEYLATA